MNEEEVERLYQELSEEYGVPIPPYVFYDRRPKVETPMPGLTITISRKMGAHIQLNEEFVGEDPFGLILLSRGTRGIRKDEAIHEFLHYYDYLIGTPVEERSVRSRTRKHVKRLRVPLRGTP